ncbi:class I SAM-dependent methyltransferase [Salipaludibacillus sp. LMS25]|jgi:ubiquinone/menaquinone biosynthesis C-methylase UbiE|uniref:class I SAM-dependent methyltransferase n=1 Tax=Salipaludibacillus sp. LMS25 TaxID=2924031 RepID=UPI0020CFEF89|nr:class I SAM-dependent methyltransferase [Salipaludibacillus sp. LMS25]UTR13281.1 class I SAM-dependent methyltransferase [Salipaludibacillus sp. LMS25]
MDFYKLLSKYYDDIFQTKEKAVTFIEDVFSSKGGKLLDLAAGTGAEAVALAKKGYDVTAVDISPLMVEKMQEKATVHDVALTAFESDMCQLDDAVLSQQDGVYCIGNSFVHLPNSEAMTRCLNSVYHLLKRGGAFIVQIVNYDRIFKHEITKLPVIKNEVKGLLFERFYTFNQEDISFQMRLTVTNDGDKAAIYERETRLMPLMKDDFMSIIQNSFFQQAEFYGTFSGEALTSDSPALIAVMRKN